MFGYLGDSNRAILLGVRRGEKTKRSGRAEERRGWIGLLQAIYVHRQNTHLFRELDSKAVIVTFFALPNSYGTYWG